MSQQAVKTQLVDPDVRQEVLSLFGSCANASAKLRLNLSYGTLNQALRGLPVRPEDAEELVSAWREWKQHYVRGVALGVTTDLNNFERVPPEETDDLADAEIEEWTRRLKGR